MLKDVYAEINRDSYRKRLLKYTRKAFNLLPKLDRPCILDIGCGSGIPTIELAKLSNGTVLGIDIDESLLDKLDKRIEKEGLSDRVETRRCPISNLDFPESFDIIWFEGATRMIDFELGLKQWKRLLKPSGFLVIHDEIKTMSNKLEKMLSLGYKLVNQLLLPENAWWTEYYMPLEHRIWGLKEKFKNDLNALRILKEVQDEINIVKNDPEESRSAFYIIQKL